MEPLATSSPATGNIMQLHQRLHTRYDLNYGLNSFASSSILKQQALKLPSSRASTTTAVAEAATHRRKQSIYQCAV